MRILNAHIPLPNRFLSQSKIGCTVTHLALIALIAWFGITFETG